MMAELIILRHRINLPKSNQSTIITKLPNLAYAGISLVQLVQSH
jgi:hypothetical protein